AAAIVGEAGLLAGVLRGVPDRLVVEAGIVGVRGRYELAEEARLLGGRGSNGCNREPDAQGSSERAASNAQHGDPLRVARSLLAAPAMVKSRLLQPVIGVNAGEIRCANVAQSGIASGVASLPQ